MIDTLDESRFSRTQQSVAPLCTPADEIYRSVCGNKPTRLKRFLVKAVINIYWFEI
jgi:hypothetical protein